MQFIFHIPSRAIKPRWDIFDKALLSNRINRLGHIELKGLRFVFIRLHSAYISKNQRKLIDEKVNSLNNIR